MTARTTLDDLYASYRSPRTQAECVAHSRQKGNDRERLAAEAAAAGDHAAAAEHRRVAKLYRDEAAMQEPFIPGRR